MPTIFQLYAGVDPAFRRHFDEVHLPALRRLPSVQQVSVHGVEPISAGSAAGTRFIVQMRFTDQALVDLARDGSARPSCEVCQAVRPDKTVLVSDGSEFPDPNLESCGLP